MPPLALAILLGTPWWVFALLALLTGLGLQALRTRRTRLPRLLARRCGPAGAAGARGPAGRHGAAGPGAPVRPVGMRTPATEPVVRLRRVDKTYAAGAIAVRALRSVSLDISAERFSMIVGPS